MKIVTHTKSAVVLTQILDRLHLTKQADWLWLKTAKRMRVTECDHCSASYDETGHIEHCEGCMYQEEL